MSYGLEVVNKNGILQFSTETQALYSKILSGSVSVGARANLASETKVTVNQSTAINNIISGLSGDDLIIAFRPTTNRTLYGRLESNTAGIFSFYNLSFSSATIQYCIFVKSPEYSAPTGEYGLNVFDTDGTTLKYSSVYPPASVETVLTVNLATASSVSYDFDTTAGLGKPWALITSGQGVTYGNQFNFEPDQSGSGIGEWQVNGLSWGTSTFTSQPIEFFDNNITQSSFYDKVGATYTSAKVVLLRGYDYT